MAGPVGLCVPAGHLGHPEGLAVDLQSRQLLAEAVVVPVEGESIDDGISPLGGIERSIKICQPDEWITIVGHGSPGHCRSD